LERGGERCEQENVGERGAGRTGSEEVEWRARAAARREARGAGGSAERMARRRLREERLAAGGGRGRRARVAERDEMEEAWEVRARGSWGAARARARALRGWWW